jgi:hypothetical protein
LKKLATKMSNAEFDAEHGKLLRESWARTRDLDAQVAEKSFLDRTMPDHARWQKRNGFEPPKPAPTPAEAAAAAVVAAQAQYDAAVLRARELGVEPGAKQESNTDAD